MNAQAVFGAIAAVAAAVLLFSMARTDQSKEWLVLIAVLVVGVALALTFGFMRKDSSGG
jgi:ABC-type uncharacterized transport system permease subunit